jgi:hypothetical protein
MPNTQEIILPIINEAGTSPKSVESQTIVNIAAHTIDNVFKFAPSRRVLFPLS